MISLSDPATAQDHAVFGDTTFAPAPRATLTFDGITPFTATGDGMTAW